MTQVVATRKGFYGKIREPGDEFEVSSEKHVSDAWMAEKGTQKYADFMRGLAGTAPDDGRIDKITGERLSAGGVAEQLAVTMEENRALKAELSEVTAERDLLLQAQNDAKVKPIEPVDPAGGKTGDDEEGTKVVRRRRHTKED